MILKHPLNNGEGGVVSATDAKVNGQSVGRIVLAECRREAVVEIRFETFAGTDDGDLWDGMV